MAEWSFYGRRQGAIMKLQRSDLLRDFAGLRASRSAPMRALGDNFEFEERVSDARREDFEGADPALALRALQDAYFKARVEGGPRADVPTTFRAINDLALYEPDIEPNQKLVRLECVDKILIDIGASFATLKNALRPSSRDDALIAKVVDQRNCFRGARPAFVARKSEVTGDIGKPDWLMRLRNRLGLGHCSPLPGQRQAYALMEYFVKDVLDEWGRVRARGAVRPFAFPTVLETQGSEHFFPAPREAGSSFTVDLTNGGPILAPIRELLHLRISYQAHHLVRVGELVGPLPDIKLAAARDAHLDKMRRISGRADFGAYMTGEVNE